MVSEIVHLLRKELLLEFRQKYALGGILLYIASTVFVCYQSFDRIGDLRTWNALFWIIVLFTAINAIAKSFVQEKGNELYLYTLASPQAVLLSKVIYNTLLMLVLTAVALTIYTVMLGGSVFNTADPLMFTTAIALGALGFATVFTMISAIASQTGNSLGIMAILGFPVILPLIIVVLRFSKNALDGLAWSVSSKYALALVLLNVVVVALSYILFPYLWRD